MSRDDTVHFILTGGTLDSFYEATKDTAVPLVHSCIPQYLKGLNLYLSTVFTEVCMKDSRDINQKDLKNILNSIQQSSHSKIIVTHGTYTMPDTAKYLKTNLKRKDQTIILTGSMIPITGFSPSDGPFNLGFALAKVAELKPGVYLCMNARIFSPEEVMKLLHEGRFISVFGEKIR